MRPGHALPCRRVYLSFASVFLLAFVVLPIAAFAQAGNFSAAVNYAVPGQINGIAVGAFTSNHVPDIAVATQTSTVSILLGNGDGTFQSQYTVQAVPSTGPYSGYVTESIAVGDFNGDGNLDLAVLCTNALSASGLPAVQGTINILLGDGTGHFTAQAPIALDGANPDQVLAADFNNDSKMDLAVLNEVSESITILLGNGDGTFNVLADASIGIQSTQIAAADFNKDGKIDLAVADNTGVGILLGNGDGTFQAITNWTPPSTNSGPPNPFVGDLVIGDFNGDGNLDIAAGVGNEGPDGLYVFLGEGNGTFQSPAIGSPVGGGYLATGDFNSDGKLDLASGGGPSANNLQFYLGSGDGTFSADAVTVAGITNAGGTNANLMQVIVTDLNGDGFPDVITSALNYPTSAVSVLLNCGLRCTSTAVTSSPTTSLFGQPVTFTATVAPTNAKATGTPTGTVIFQATTDSEYILPPVTTTIGNAILSDGVATLTYSSLAPGQYIISANYQGDSNFNSSTSTADPTQPQQLVGSALTTTSLSSSMDPSAPGQSVTLTATVTPVAPASGVPTGTVTFSVNGNAVASQPMNGSGVATFTTSSLATGTDSITAAYGGGGYFGSSTSSAISQIVGTNAGPFAVSASPTSATVTAGGSAVFTIAVATVPTMTSAISLSCMGLPMGASCSFSPAQITPKGATAKTTLTITTTGSSWMFQPFLDLPTRPNPALPLAAFGLLAFVVLLAGRKQGRQKATAGALVLLCMFVVLTGAIGCGGGSNSTPPPNVTPSGTTQISVMASSSGSSQTTTISLTVN
ncbi:MAG: FG-GAP-like repeat-containing protein [Candidatus Acidiferrales bacterium]